MRGLLSIAALALAMTVLSGCGDLPRSHVHGTVSFQGNAVTGGTVIFLTKDNMTHIADIQPDGSYAVSGVPRGPVRVSVQQPPPRPAPRSQTAPAEERGNAETAADDAARLARQKEAPVAEASGVRVPEKYADPSQSGLAFELTDADQAFPIDLK